MATWTTVASTDLDADSPITQALMEALYHNPTAMAEGAAGAPTVQKEALGEGAVGDYLLSTDLVYQTSFVANNDTDVVDSYVYTTITTTGLINFAVAGYGETSTSYHIGTQYKINGSWYWGQMHTGLSGGVGGTYLSDGTNVRIYAQCLNATKTVTATAYVEKLNT